METEIQGLLKQASKSALRNRVKSSSQSNLDVIKGVGIYRLHALLKYSATLPKHTLENSELLFDRLLLTHSKHYRRTRSLADSLKIELKPRYRSYWHSIEGFNPHVREVPFMPIAHEITWLLDRIVKNYRPGSALEAHWVQKYVDLKTHNLPTYHELNHFVMYSLLKPTKKFSETKRSAYYYFAFNEALAVMRDIQLAEEVGAIGDTLVFCMTLYRGRPTGHEARLKKMDFPQFASALFFCYHNQLGYTRSEISKMIKKTCIKDFFDPLLTVNRGFIDKTFPAWWKKYSKTHGNQIYQRPLPPLAKAPKMEFNLASPQDLFTDLKALEKFYRWYQTLFKRMHKMDSAVLIKKYDSCALFRDYEHLSKVKRILFPKRGKEQGQWIVLYGPGGDESWIESPEPVHKPYGPTRHLAKCPYIKKILNDLPAPKLAVRILAVQPQKVLPPHRDLHRHFRGGVIRLNVPIQCPFGLDYSIGDSAMNWRPGELWYGDFSLIHSVANRGASPWVTLVIDVGVTKSLLKLFPRDFVDRQLEEGISFFNETKSLNRKQAEKFSCELLMPAWPLRLASRGSIIQAKIRRVKKEYSLIVRNKRVLTLRPVESNRLEAVGLGPAATFEFKYNSQGKMKAAALHLKGCVNIPTAKGKQVELPALTIPLQVQQI